MTELEKAAINWYIARNAFFTAEENPGEPGYLKLIDGIGTGEANLSAAIKRFLA